MIYQFYEWHLLQNLDNIPQVICFMISDDEMKEDPLKLQQVIRWSLDISEKVHKNNPDSPGIKEIIVHISTPRPEIAPRYLQDILALSAFVNVHLHYADNYITDGTGIPVTIAIGKSGREEISDAIQAMAADNIAPEEVSTQLLEQYLTFSHTPDCVIKTGGAHLVDFLIWQSVYSELFFLDLNWGRIRKVDLIRAFRDFRDRNRRFGT